MRLLLAAIALLLVAAGCTSEPTTDRSTEVSATRGAPPSPSAEPNTPDAAKAAAQAAFDAYAAGDAAGAWDLYTGAGKAAITRADYVRLLTECKQLPVRLEARSARQESPGVVVVQGWLGTVGQAYTMRYEGGRWLLQPRPETLADYKLGVDQLVTKKRASGSCT